MICPWIVCESGNHWLAGLHRFAPTSLPSERDRLTLQHSADVAEAESWCLSGRPAVLWSHRRDEPRLTGAIYRLQEFHLVQIVALPPDIPFGSLAARQASLLYAEIGVTAVIQDYAQLHLACRLAKKYWMEPTTGPSDSGYLQSLWQSLPWHPL
jgi:hypothetical protein